MTGLNFKKLAKRQQGLASIIVVLMLTIVITIVSLGLSKLMDRATRQALSNNVSSAADYAAISGINDVVAWLKGNNSSESTHCQDLITAPDQPFHNLSTLSSTTNTKYTCILVDKHPHEIVYQNLPAYKSKVVALTPSTKMKSLMISWQANDTNRTGLPPANTQNLYDETTWNSTGRQYQPVVRVTLYAVKNNDLMVKNIQSETYFLYPTAGGTAGDLITFADRSAASTPILIQTKCNAKSTGVSTSDFNQYFNGTADKICNMVLYNLPTNQLYYYYLRIMPLYIPADVEIKGMDENKQPIDLGGSQYKIDVTARSSNSVKRLRAYVDAPNSSTQVSIVDPSTDSIPEFALRTTATVCKRLKVINGGPHAGADFSEANNCPAQVGTTSPGYFNLEFYSDPNPVAYGAAADVHWNIAGANNATNCNGTGGPWGSGFTNFAKDSQGHIKDGHVSSGNLTSPLSMTLDCWNDDYDTGTQYLTIGVLPQPVPTISFSSDAGDNAIAYNAYTKLHWTITTAPATSCKGWGGEWGVDANHATALGSTLNHDYTFRTANLTTTTTYSMQCENNTPAYQQPDGSPYKTPVSQVTVNVTPQYPVPAVSLSGPSPFPYNGTFAVTYTLSGGSANWCWGWGGSWGADQNHGQWITPLSSGPHNKTVGPFTSNQTFNIQCGNNSQGYNDYHTPIQTINLLVGPQEKLNLTVHGYRSTDSVSVKVGSNITSTCVAGGGLTNTCATTYNAPTNVVLIPNPTGGSGGSLFSTWNPCPGTLSNSNKYCNISLNQIYSADAYFVHK